MKPLLMHVSLHDVAPPFADETEAALRLCAEHGLKPALLVVPDHHERAPLAESPAFCDRLRELADQGHEIYLHGYTHRASPRAEQASRARHFFRQKVVSAGEAEFASIDAREGTERLARGLELLRETLALPVHGFVAPAWSFQPWLLPMLAQHGVAYTEDHLYVYDPETGRKRASLVLNFASRSRSRIATTSLYCRAARPLATVLPARIALHPGDMRVALLRHEARSLLAWGARRTVCTGPQLLD